MNFGVEIKKAGKVIFEQKNKVAFPAASLAKVPICLYVFENDINLEEHVPLFKKDLISGTGWLQYMQPGLKIKIKDLIYLILAESDNTATKCLVRHIGGPQNINKHIKNLVKKTQLEAHKDESFGYGITTPEEIVLLFEKLIKQPLAYDYLRRNRFDWGLRNKGDNTKLKIITSFKDWLFIKTNSNNFVNYKKLLLFNKRPKSKYPNKEGSWQTNRHEVALINSYSIAILTSGYNKDLAYDKSHPAFEIFNKIGAALAK